MTDLFYENKMYFIYTRFPIESIERYQTLSGTKF